MCDKETQRSKGTLISVAHGNSMVHNITPFLDKRRRRLSVHVLRQMLHTIHLHLTGPLQKLIEILSSHASFLKNGMFIIDCSGNVEAYITE